jgi:hypothetical protein
MPKKLSAKCLSNRNLLHLILNLKMKSCPEQVMSVLLHFAISGS